MALDHQTYTVGTSPTLIATIHPKSPYTAVLIFNNDNNPIFIGGPNVSTTGTTQGLQVNKSTSSSQVWLNANDKLYAVSSAGTASNAVTVLFSDTF